MAGTASFRADMEDLFSRRRFAHVGNWRFSEPLFSGDKVNGLELWDQLTERARRGGNYYIFSDEVKLLTDCLPDILTFIPPNSILVDLGPGSKEAILTKIGTLLNNTGSRIVANVAVDLVPEVLKNAENIFAHTFPQVQFIPLQSDIFKPLNLPEQGYRLAVIFGQTLFNIAMNPTDGELAKRMILQSLVALRRHLRLGERIIITQNCSQNREEIEAAYWDQKEVWLNLFYRVERDLQIKGDYDPEGFVYEPCWMPSSSILSHTAVPKTVMRFGLGEEIFCLSPQDGLYMHNTAIYPASVFEALTTEANFQICYCRRNDRQRMALYILEAGA